MISNYFKIIVLLILSQAVSYVANAQECIAAYDFGQGGTFYVAANPDENNTGKSTLIYSTPKNSQVAPWISTGYSTMGQSDSSGDTNEAESILKIYVSGAWGPWGGDPTKMTTVCAMQACDPGSNEQEPCLKGGQHVDDSTTSQIPCKLTSGWGLYGLVAIGGADPNDLKYAKTLPSEHFRTFRISPLQSDKDGNFLELRYTEQCDLDANGKTVCKPDKDAYGRNIVIKGDLYFKILDDYYEDNTGSYTVTIASGVAGKPGFIQLAIEYFTQVMKSITKKLFISFTSNTGFITIVKSILVLYVAISGLLFMMGLLRSHISELIVRLFKVALMSILISSNSWEFFNNNLFSFFTDGALSIATMITKSAFGYSSQYGAGQYILPENATAVSVFDNVVKMMIHPSIHKKIFGILFYKWYVVYLVFIYMSLLIMLTAIVRSVALYLTSIMLITLLLVISPIFMVMMLFKLTKEMFDTWLKQLWVNALMLIVVSASMALMINLILNQLENLLYYKVCWEILWTLEIAHFKLFDFWFWHPSVPSQLDTCITRINFFSYLIVCVLFSAFMQQIPELIDTLAQAGVMPLTRLFGGMNSTFHNNVFYRKATGMVYQVRSVASISMPLALTNTGQRAVGMVTGTYDSVTDKFERAASGGGGALFNTPIASGIRDFVGSKLEVINAPSDAISKLNRSGYKVTEDSRVSRTKIFD